MIRYHATIELELPNDVPLKAALPPAAKLIGFSQERFLAPGETHVIKTVGVDGAAVGEPGK